MSDFTITNLSQLLLMSGEINSYSHRDELLGLISAAAIAIKDGKIAWYGPSSELPERFLDAQVIDGHSKVLMPALIDSHTHLAFAGSREDEYEMRCSGVAYQEIAKSGGGIKSTVRQTRASSFEELYQLTKAKLLRMMEHGLGVVEIKSGYGLDLETEVKQLEVIKQLKQELPLEIVATFLGAHEFPAEYSQDEYIDFLVGEALPTVADQDLATFCDVFCEKGVFSPDQSRVVLSAAKSLGFKLKLHAEELSESGGAELAAELGAVSADHLVCISDHGIEQMVQAGVVFNLLPATTLFLGKKDYAPWLKIKQAGGLVALSTDCNPGSCTCENLPLVTTIACSQMGMSPAESLWAITRGASKAVGLCDTHGQIKLGSKADLALFAVPNFQQIPYIFGRNALDKLFIAGELVVDRS